MASWLWYFQVAWFSRAYFTYQQNDEFQLYPGIHCEQRAHQQENKNANAQTEDGNRAFCAATALPADYKLVWNPELETAEDEPGSAHTNKRVIARGCFTLVKYQMN